MDNSPNPESVFDVRDIVNAMSLIDDAAKQGVYKGWDDMQKAITTRIRLQRFAENVIKMNEATQPAVAPIPDESTSNQAPEA